LLCKTFLKYFFIPQKPLSIPHLTLNSLTVLERTAKIPAFIYSANHERRKICQKIALPLLSGAYILLFFEKNPPQKHFDMGWELYTLCAMCLVQKNEGKLLCLIC